MYIFQKYYKTLLLLMQVGIFFTYCSQNSSSNVLHVNKVSNDSLLVLYETGQLESIETFTINAPMRWNMEYRIIRLAPEGSFVQPGDTVVYFDMQPLMDRLTQARQELQKAKEDLAQTLEQNALSIETQLKDIERLKMQFEIDSTRLANARFEAKTRQEEIALELEKTRLQLQRAIKKLQAQKIINDTKERLKRIKIEQARIELNRVLLMQNEMKLVTHYAGIVIYPYIRSTSGRVKIKEGETIFPGRTVLKIANLDRMQAIVKINEVDRHFIKIGQRVKLTVDAYPDTVFSGKVVNIAKVASKDYDQHTVKVYPVEVHLDSRANFRLKPGLSVRAGIILDTLQNVFRVPNWCLFEEGEKNFVFPENSNSKILVQPVVRMDGFTFVRGALKNGWLLKTKTTMQDEL